MNMLNFFRTPKEKTSKTFTQDFYQKSYHKWIENDQLVKRSFDLLLELIANDQELNKRIEEQGPVAFIPANGKMACSVRGETDMRFVVVFPDLVQIMKSASPTRAIAVLAHELGHIFHNHHQRSQAGRKEKPLTTLEAQIEADAFAARLGLAKELQDVLLEVEEDEGAFVETRVRISQLTAYLLSDSQGH